MTPYQKKLVASLDNGDLLRVTWGGIKFGKRCIRTETEDFLFRHYGQELMSIGVKGKRCVTDYACLNSFLHAHRQTMEITRATSYFRFRTKIV